MVPNWSFIQYMGGKYRARIGALPEELENHGGRGLWERLVVTLACGGGDEVE